jgi:hypothetical protein
MMFCENLDFQKMMRLDFLSNEALEKLFLVQSKYLNFLNFIIGIFIL